MVWVKENVPFEKYVVLNAGKWIFLTENVKFIYKTEQKLVHILIYMYATLNENISGMHGWMKNIVF